MWLFVLLGLIAASVLVYAINRTVGFVVMQVTLALALILATYGISVWVMSRDKLAIDFNRGLNNNVRTLIVDGHADSMALQYKTFTTVSSFAINYVALPRSINRYGGAQFTYQFWMLLQNTSQDVIGRKDIFLRGDATKYTMMTVDNENDVLGITTDTMVKCPRIRFNGAYHAMAVELNTTVDPNPPPFQIGPEISDTASPNVDPATRVDVMRLVPQKWVLYTFAFQDHVPINDFERGIEMRFYVNDMLYQTTTMRSALKQNSGDVYLFPSGGIEGCKIGDLAYYNYAVPLSEIETHFATGPPTFSVTTTTTATPLYLSEYNKLDMHQR